MKQWNIDAISMSYHKIYGPLGLGLLILNNLIFSQIKNHPLIFGSQNYGFRGGTINISGIYAGHIALNKVIYNRDKKNNHLFEMKIYIINYLINNYPIEDYKNYYGKPDDYTVFSPHRYGIIFIGDNPSSPNTLLFSIIKYGS